MKESNKQIQPAHLVTRRHVSVADYEQSASALLPESGVKTHLGVMGAPTWTTNSNNVQAFSRWTLRPRILSGVRQPSLSTTALGKSIALPIMIAPAGGQQRFHVEGECAMARGAAHAGTIMTLSTMATFDIEEIRRAATDALLWFQLYVLRDRAVSASLVKRAEQAGYSAVVLTLDNISGHLARSPRNRVAGINGPDDIFWPSLSNERVLANFRGYRGTAQYPPASLAEFFDSSLTWADLEWLRGVTRLPIVLKGVQTAEDADLAMEHGIDAIVVSNHGGTPSALDGLGSSLDCLREVVKTVNQRMEVYFDSGIRHGADVLKALALGARAVFIGRAALWGLTVAGEEGVADVLDILRAELQSAMCIAGVANATSVPRTAIGRLNA